ncbi:hypothetical protein [Fimbriiglobus ruber]|uniref:Uncharacterized protein n=1 Tax=Fimbriiglobus ruber TaxID=1908690 RepID=A0A225D720_9BACT|nr:hypothetical protein [Fimbriiglobus ruber]OWK36763.1 hypothetical protein FRUB_09326 [Fimbriiglobus ruber]
MRAGEFLALMAAGYLMTITVETAVLWVGLSRRHPPSVRLAAGVWLTACTYPVVWIVLPPLFASRWQYLLVAETFAPVAECALFWLAFVRGAPPRPAATVRDMAAVAGANLASFAFGELLAAAGWW